MSSSLDLRDLGVARLEERRARGRVVNKYLGDRTFGARTIVALQPGELPATDDSDGYLRALAAAESAGRPDLAEPSYRAAAKRWPDSSLAWLGLGNSAYARGEQVAAERLYRHALEIDSGNAAALNNLASTIAEQGRCDEAQQLLTAAMALPDLHVQMSDVLLQSRAEIGTCK